MNRNKYLSALVLLTLSFLLLACGKAEPPSIGEVVAAKSLDSAYKPLELTSTYQAVDTIYLSVQVKNLLKGSKVTVQYKRDGKLYKETDMVSSGKGSGYFGFMLESVAGHELGSYTAEVYLDGSLAKTLTFTVVEGDSRTRILDVISATDLDANFMPINRTTVFKPSDTISISVRVQNVKPGMVIKLVYYYDAQVEVQSITTTDDGKIGNYGFNLSPTVNGFPVGEYVVEAFLDDVSYTEPLHITVAK